MRLVALKQKLVERFDAMSTGGLIVGTTFFALALTPSLLPRDYVLQGVLCGCAFAIGYGLGAYLQWLWHWLELKLPGEKFARRVRLAALGLSGVVAIAFLALSSGWQNSVRDVMAMPPVNANHAVLVAAIAILPATILITLGWLLVKIVDATSRRLKLVLPRRVAFAVSLVLVFIATSFVVNGVVVRGVLRAADTFYAELDALAGQYEEPPVDALRSGSAASLIPWNTIGRDSRGYVMSGPTADEIAALTGRAATTPVRVYVGLRSAETFEERAQLALEEMKRVGAFSRSVLVLVMPVGTGWVDPVGMDTLEILHGGDVASVALQYSYLTSWISLLAEPDVGVEASRALFSAVYGYWRTLPHEERPKLYLYGMSLGAYASQSSTELYDVLDDPFQGALWVGPPFASQAWRSLVSGRVPGSKAWLPQVGNSSTVRFANQFTDLASFERKWGPTRIVYLQYASDPIVFFDPDAWRREPAWMRGDRASDVTPQLRWFPIVTSLQLALDLTLSQSAPIGYGHVYAPQHYIDAWVAVTDPPGWDETSLARLRRELSRTGPIQNVADGWFRRSLPAAPAALLPAARDGGQGGRGEGG